jgi:outer membrane receptor for ferrienterochelin and colicins
MLWQSSRLLEVMRITAPLRHFGSRSLFALTLLSSSAAAAAAQTGAISGRVSSASSGRPLAGASVAVLESDGREVTRVLSRADGQFTVMDLRQGRYTVTATFVGYSPSRTSDVSVVPGETTRLSFSMSSLGVRLDSFVVSVSRAEERILDAPASIAVVKTQAIEEAPALTPVEHVRDAPGVDIATVGVMQSNIVTRGFNDIFSSSLLLLTDNRYNFVPSLRVNAPWLMSSANEDIERIEVQLGPGAALYGPNAAAGVLHVITKSPFDWQGTTLSVGSVARAGNATGSASILKRAAFRHAGVVGEKFGYKISGQFLSGEDWPERDSAEVSARRNVLAGGASDSSLLVGRRDFIAERWSAEARAEYRPSESSDASLALGRTHAASAIELTGLGAAQVKGWSYDFVHARVRYQRLVAQAFANASNAGKTFLLRTGQPVRDRSRMFVAQVQHGIDWGTRQTFLYGVDAQRTEPRTEGTITGRNEAKDVIDEIGGYLHSQTQLSPALDLLAVVRVDRNSRLGHDVFSPRAALVYKPADDHALRLTYNRAFNTPGTNAFFLDVVAGTLAPLPFNVRAIGVPEGGLSFRRDCGGTLCMRSPFNLSPSQALPLDATRVWPAVVNLVRLQGGPDMRSLPAPSATDVRSVLRLLNPTTLTFDDADQSDVHDVAPLREIVTSTLEAGYKGTFAGQYRLALDVYYERKNDFVGSLIVETPNVFLDAGDVGQSGTLASYLARYMSADAARQLARQIGGVAGSSQNPGIPLGTIAPEGELGGTPDLILTYRNFGRLDRWGSDAAAEVEVSPRVSLNGTYSWTSRNLFPKDEVGGLSDVTLNAPKRKASLAFHFRDAQMGLSASLRARHVDGFPMSSGLYVGSVPSYTLADAGAAYRFLSDRSALLSLNVQNILNRQHREFIGAPVIGRFATLGLQYTFR